MPQSPAQKEDSARQKAQVLKLRRTGISFQAIGDQLGVTRQRAHQVYKQALEEIPAEEVSLYRAEQADRLDALLVRANAVLDAEHVIVQHGKVVMQDGVPIPDQGPVLDAIRVVLAIEKQRADLYGFNVPVKQQIQSDQTITYAFEGVDLGNLR
jgi:hypothetical protein